MAINKTLLLSSFTIGARTRIDFELNHYHHLVRGHRAGTVLQEVEKISALNILKIALGVEYYSVSIKQRNLSITESATLGNDLLPKN